LNSRKIFSDLYEEKEMIKSVRIPHDIGFLKYGA